MISAIKIQLSKKGVHFTTAKKGYIRLLCPSCEKLRVKNWDDPELYYHPARKRGRCFRCDLRVKNEKEFLALFDLRPLGFSLNIPTEVKKEVRWPTPLPDDCVPAYQSKRAMTYLANRHMHHKHVERYGILFCRSGWYGQRLIIPVFNHRQAYCTYVSRTIEDALPETRKKYEFPPGSGISHLLFNLCFFQRQSTVWITEGPFDAFHTFPYSVATFGKHISESQINLLRIRGFQRVVLMWDWDAHATTPALWARAVQRLKKHFFVTEAKLPREDTDPTNYTLSELKDIVRG